MSWTAPRTWVTGETVTAAMMNAHVRDNLLWAGSHHGARAYKSASQTVPTGNEDVVTFNSESYDTDAFHSTVSNTSRFVAPVAGYYLVKFEAAVDADGSQHNGRMVLSLRQNAAGSSAGGTLLDSSSFAVHANTQGAHMHWQGLLAAADYVEAFFLSATEARDLTGGVGGTNVEITWIGF